MEHIYFSSVDFAVLLMRVRKRSPVVLGILIKPFFIPIHFLVGEDDKLLGGNILMIRR
jgi:hypothetical protein